LTEIIQIIGRATRDATGKTYSRFTNLIAEPDASTDAVTDAINDTHKGERGEGVIDKKLNYRN
jgi:hypothetical protein